ncbi:hypothetical protein DFS34DRAFT_449382 [Phlyctochytrium arcticum]|nr:hypothetical protein DFS34DRAFT_449382 [Phlyctochytrium arcticum]
MRSVDDPFCVYSIVNGTEVISYTGYLSRLDAPEDACMGVNIRGLNSALTILGLLFGFAGIYFASKFLKERRTVYNMVLIDARCTTRSLSSEGRGRPEVEHSKWPEYFRVRSNGEHD